MLLYLQKNDYSFILFNELHKYSTYRHTSIGRSPVSVSIGSTWFFLRLQVRPSKLNQTHERMHLKTGTRENLISIHMYATYLPPYAQVEDDVQFPSSNSYQNLYSEATAFIGLLKPSRIISYKKLIFWICQHDNLTITESPPEHPAQWGFGDNVCDTSDGLPSTVCCSAWALYEKPHHRNR